MVLSGRSKIFRVLEDRVDRGFPVVIPYINILLRDHWDEITNKPWWTLVYGRPEDVVEVYRDLLNSIPIDWIELRMQANREIRSKIKPVNDRLFIVEGNSVREIPRPSKGGSLTLIESRVMIRDREDVDRLFRIKSAWDILDSGSMDSVEVLVKALGEEYFTIGKVSSPLWSVFSAFGFLNTIRLLYSRPELIKYASERTLSCSMEVVKAYSEVGVDGIFIEECLTSRDIISLKMFEEYSKPYIERLISYAKNLGLKVIYYYCGDVSDRIEYLVSFKPDALAFEEGKKNFRIDIEWVDSIVKGRCCLLGNINSIWIIQEGSIEDIKREVLRQIKVGKRSGKFIVSTGSPITPQTPISKVRAFVEITRQLVN